MSFTLPANPQFSDLPNEKLTFLDRAPFPLWCGYQVSRNGLAIAVKLLGRRMTTNEGREVMSIARHIASILLLKPFLDADYQAIKTATYLWPSS